MQGEGQFSGSGLWTELRGLYAKALDTDADRTSFVATSIAEDNRAFVAKELATFHDNLATLLVTIYIGTWLVTSERHG